MHHLKAKLDARELWYDLDGIVAVDDAVVTVPVDSAQCMTKGDDSVIIEEY